MKKTYIIAEIGPNHNGDINIAIDMIKKLSSTGVNAVKFQLANPDLLYSKESFKAKYQKENDKSETAIEMSRKNQLTLDEHRYLNQICKENKVDYLCTGFDLSSVKFLNEELDIKYFKIPSGEILSVDILQYISNYDKPIILSTGMSTYEEIELSLKLINKNFPKQVTILHCISNYPAKLINVNLRNILKIKDLFNCSVGFSDHTLGNECAISAVAMGSNLIEKHVTFDKSAVGPDHKASCTIEEFSDLIRQIRNIEIALGTKERIISEEELETRNVARKSIVTKKNIKEGQLITIEDICFKRPGTGFLPIELNRVINKKASKNILQDTVIRNYHIQK